MSALAKIKLSVIAVEILFFSLFFVVLPSVIIRNRQDTSHTKDDVTINIEPGKVYKQEFISTKNGLNSVSLQLKNPALQNRQNFILELADPQGAIIRQFGFNGFNIGDPSWLQFKFNPILDSQNKKYEIRLSTTIADPTLISAPFDSKTNTYLYKTTYTPGSLLHSLGHNLSLQLSRISSREPVLNIAYIGGILLLNIALLLI